MLQIGLQLSPNQNRPSCSSISSRIRVVRLHFPPIRAVLAAALPAPHQSEQFYVTPPSSPPISAVLVPSYYQHHQSQEPLPCTRHPLVDPTRWSFQAEGGGPRWGPLAIARWAQLGFSHCLTLVGGDGDGRGRRVQVAPVFAVGETESRAECHRVAEPSRPSQ